MARALSNRLRRLERRRPTACPACGHGGPGPVAYEVIVPEAVERVTDRGDAPEPRRCGTCGRPTEVSIRFLEARAEI